MTLCKDSFQRPLSKGFAHGCDNNTNLLLNYLIIYFELMMIYIYIYKTV